LIVLPDERIIFYMMNATENMMSSKDLINPATDLIVGSCELTAEQQKFLEAHEEMHRQYGHLPKARVTPDMVINQIIRDTSGSMIHEDNSGSMAGVMGGTDWKAMLQAALAPKPYSGPRHMLIVTDGDTNVMKKFPKPKYEKFTSNEAMIEEKLLTGRNRRSNKAIAEVRRESRKLNKLRTAEQSRIKRQERKKKSVNVLTDTSSHLSTPEMREFLKELTKSGLM
jgi:hypothetical protein